MAKNVIKLPDAIKLLAEELNTTQKTARMILKGLENVIHETVVEKQQGFPLGGSLGNIVVYVAPEKPYITPTGEKGFTPAHYRARLATSQSLKQDLKNVVVPEELE